MVHRDGTGSDQRPAQIWSRAAKLKTMDGVNVDFANLSSVFRLISDILQPFKALLSNIVQKKNDLRV